jgi:hypothetical protein
MKAYFLCLVVLTMVAATQGQSAEVTLAYQFNHLEAGAFGLSGSTNVPIGASGNVNIPIIPWFGITGDFGWMQKSDAVDSYTGSAHIFTYGGGPQFTYRENSNLQPFVRFIVGGGTISGSVTSLGSASESAYFISPGGGLDLRLMKHIWLRAGFDYFHSDKQGVSLNGLQIIGGLQFRFGRNVRTLDDSNSRTQSMPTQKETIPVTEASSADAGHGHNVSIASLGFSISVREGGGIEIKNILPGSVASHAGLKVGDVVNSINGKIVKNPLELANELADYKPGDKIAIGYLVRGWWQTEVIVILPTN